MNLQNFLLAASMAIGINQDTTRSVLEPAQSLYFSQCFRYKYEGQFYKKEDVVAWDATKTAVIVCDMGNIHY